MIRNKTVTIVKENQFDKGWTLFSPTSFGTDKNPNFKTTDITDVVKLITYSNQINLILSEACLPSRIVNELKWVNEYIKINIIAKNKEVIERYNDLHFNSFKIDESLNINYIGITGKGNKYYMIDTPFYEIDDSIEKSFFGSKNERENYPSLAKARTLIIGNSGRHQNFSTLFSLATQYGMKCRYIINYQHFDRNVYDFAKENNIELFISDFVNDIVLTIDEDGSINKMSVLNDGHVVFCPIERISNYIGKLYKNLFLEDNIETKDIPTGTYSCFDGHNELVDIADEVIVQNDIVINEISDFIDETFDKSIIENHNYYSNKGKKTKYIFTLIPPLFDSSYVESSIYAPIHKLHKDWVEINKIKFDKIIEQYREFMTKDSKLIPFIAYSTQFSSKLEQMINDCSYSSYHSVIKEAINSYKEYQANIFDDCAFMFDEINSENSETKFDKFDDEINGYRQTIKEKNKLIQNGIDVLSNKRRIEILNKKIEDLAALKEKFENNAATRYNKKKDSFIDYCKKLTDNATEFPEEDDSIGKIINTSEGSKLIKLNDFILNHLKQINDYLTNSIACLRKMEDVHIPVDYPVFEKNGQRYIVINELSEYNATQDLSKEFSLKWLIRR